MGLEGALTTPLTCTSVRLVVTDKEYSLPKPIQYFKSGWKSNVEE